jgi:hypothetical protein
MKQPRYKAYIKSIQWYMDVISIYWNDDGTIEEILCTFEGNESDPFEYKLEDVELMEWDENI